MLTTRFGSCLGVIFGVLVLASCTRSQAPVAEPVSTAPVTAQQVAGEPTPTPTAEPPQTPPVWSNPDLPGIVTPDAALVKTLWETASDQAQHYVPRTRHMLAGGKPRYINRLVRESSPYLLQHAHNPVNWFAYGTEAFERAVAENKPVLLSVGYSTCHWCHVMERESFEDEEIAAFINQHFVAIKMDREERPDVDAQYMNAVHMLAGRGGWPMTVVLTPDGRPFFAGTYFPARDGDRGSRKGFLSILRELADSYQNSPEEAVKKAETVSQRLMAAATPQLPGDLPQVSAIMATVNQLASGFDNENGGFGRAPKFPTPSNLLLLLRAARRGANAEWTRMVTVTLDKMARGGIYDQVGGGFHRYATDPRWLVPHFEKMLYDNAQLVTVYLEAFQSVGDARYATVAREVLDYVLREMTDAEGGFYSATDADSPVPGKEHHEEGWFFTWTVEDMAAVLDARTMEIVTTLWGVTERGNFEGRNILSVVVPEDELAKKMSLTTTEIGKVVEDAKQRLYDVRIRRPKPILDDKILTSWNGMMISAMAKGAMVLADERYGRAGVKAAEFLLANAKKNGEDIDLVRSIRTGKTSGVAVLDDYAFLMAGLLDLFEWSGDVRWWDHAVTLERVVHKYYGDETRGGYFLTRADTPGMFVREKPDYDGAEPSGNAVMALNLLRMAEWSGNETYREQAVATLRSVSTSMNRPGGAALLLSALDFLTDRPLQIVVVNPPGESGGELVKKVASVYVPNHVLTHATEGDDMATKTQRLPLLKDKRAQDGKTTAYVCRGNVCDRPTADPKELVRQLRITDPYPSLKQ